MSVKPPQHDSTPVAVSDRLPDSCVVRKTNTLPRWKRRTVGTSMPRNTTFTPMVTREAINPMFIRRMASPPSKCLFGFPQKGAKTHPPKEDGEVTHCHRDRMPCHHINDTIGVQRGCIDVRLHDGTRPDVGGDIHRASNSRHSRGPDWPIRKPAQAACELGGSRDAGSCGR